MDWDPRLDQQLVRRLAAALKDCELLFGAQPSKKPLMDARLSAPLPREIGEQLRNWIGDRPVETFVYSQLLEEVASTPARELPSEIRAPLTAVPGLRDLDAAARRYLARLKELPQEYRLALPLPIAPLGAYSAPVAPQIDIGPGLQLATRSSLVDVPIVSVWALESGAGVAAHQWVLFQEAHGFLARSSTTATLQGALDRFQSLLGVAAALGALGIGLYGSSKSDLVQAFQRREAGWAPVPTVPRLARELVGERGLVWAPERWNGDGWAALSRLLRSAAQTDKTTKHVLPAAQWYYESLVASDELNAFVKIAVALETLLGHGFNQSEGRLTQLLANRCAYLVSGGIRERSVITKRFVEFYELRSKVLHGGVRDIGERERELLYFAQEMAGRALSKELELKRADLGL